MSDFELSPAEKSAARAALIKAGITTRGLDDQQLKEQAAGLATPAPAPAAKAPAAPAPAPAPAAPAPAPAPAAPAGGDMAAAVAAAIAPFMVQQQQAPAMDTAAIVALIKEHSTTTLNIPARAQYPALEIKGAHKQLAEVVTWLSTGTHVFLTGPAGSGKTTIAKQAADALGLKFYSSGAIMAAYELLGVRAATGEYLPTGLRQAYEKGGLFLLDEIDGCSARALVAFNQLLANDCFTFPDGMVEKHPDFVVVGGANTTGQGASRQYVGRAELDKATLDRFIQIDVEYDLKLEERLTLAEYAAHGGEREAVAIEWVKLVQKTRKAVADMKSTALITPRAAIHGARGLARGLALDKVRDQVLYKHLTDDQRARLTAKGV